MSRVAIKGQMDDEGTVRDRTFEDCEIIGPATIVPVGTGNCVMACGYLWSAENLGHFRGGPGVSDVVLVVGCTFRRCNFASDVDATQLFLPSS
jgi:hypothetical protein